MRFILPKKANSLSLFAESITILDAIRTILSVLLVIHFKLFRRGHRKDGSKGESEKEMSPNCGLRDLLLVICCVCLVFL